MAGMMHRSWEVIGAHGAAGILAVGLLLLSGLPVRAQLTLATLQEALTKAVKEGKHVIVPPFIQERDGKLSYYDVGGVGRSVLESGGRTPLMYPTDLVGSLEAWKRYLTKKDERAACEPHLTKVETYCWCPA